MVSETAVDVKKQFELHEQLHTHDWTDASPTNTSFKICTSCGALHGDGNTVPIDKSVVISSIFRKDFKRYVGTNAYERCIELYDGNIEFMDEKRRRQFMKQVVRTMIFGTIASAIIGVVVYFCTKISSAIWGYIGIAFMSILIFGAVGLLIRLVTGDFERYEP